MNIDWRTLLRNLQRRGLGARDIANRALVPAADVAALLNRHSLEPPFSTGLKLLDLHHDICPEQHTTIVLIET